MRYQELITESLEINSDGWLDSNTGKFHNVKFQKHATFVRSFFGRDISYAGYRDDFGEKNYAVYDHAYDQGWIRIALYNEEMNISGRAHFIKQGWKYLRKITLSKDQVIIAQQTHFLKSEGPKDMNRFVLPQDRGNMNRFAMSG